MAVLKVWDGSAWVPAVTPAPTAYGRASKTTVQSISSGTTTLVSWQAGTTYGTVSLLSTGLLVGEAGLYEVTASIQCRPPASSGRSRIEVQKNGIDLFGRGVANVALDVVNPTLACTDIHYFTSGDVINATYYQQTPGATSADIAITSVSTYLSAVKVGH
jgi:hypothetical protein